MFLELTVKLKEHPELGEAKIKSFYYDIEGAVKLDKPINGFTSWNIEALTIVKQEIKT